MKKREILIYRIVSKSDTSVKPGPDSGIGAGSGTNKPKPNSNKFNLFLFIIGSTIEVNKEVKANAHNATDAFANFMAP